MTAEKIDPIFKKPLIYLLDDDVDFNAFFKLKMRKNELQVECFSDVASFMMGLKRALPDLCIIDLNLKEKEGAGFKVLEAIRNKLSEDIPLFVMSARTDSKDLKQAFDLGANDYICKPFNEAFFMEKIKAYSKIAKDIEYLEQRKIPLDEQACTIIEKYSIIEVHEDCLKIRSKYFMNKDAKLTLKGLLIQDIIGDDLQADCVVIDSEILDSGDFLVTLKYEKLDPIRKKHIRCWIASMHARYYSKTS
jgi:DNA-binding response OmpR family regulator